MTTRERCTEAKPIVRQPRWWLPPAHSTTSSVQWKGVGRSPWRTSCALHRTLMADDPPERLYAGKVREMQNSIGGSDHSPRGALYVPPPPRTVDNYLTDLLRFANRGDVNVLAQAAIAHAQFESIHPFTDGNGRIGRALINTILRRRGALRCRVVVPLASALVARRENYFDTLSAYRSGNAGPIIAAFSAASLIAAAQARVTARTLWLNCQTIGETRPEGLGQGARRSRSWTDCWRSLSSRRRKRRRASALPPRVSTRQSRGCMKPRSSGP